MRLGLELPTKYLPYFSKLTDLDFCLAQVALEDEQYAAFFAQQAKAGRMVLMDNGFHEMGRPLSIPELERAVEIVQPPIVIAPDWLGKPVETYEATAGLLKRLRNHPTTKVAAVIVGSSSEERAAYFESLRQQVVMFCLPFREPRRDWFKSLAQGFPVDKWPTFLHLLGMNEFEEVQWFKRATQAFGFQPFSVSIDTGKPIKWGMLNVEMDFDVSPRGANVKSADIHKIEKISPDQMQCILRNIAYLRRFI